MSKTKVAMGAFAACLIAGAAGWSHVAMASNVHHIAPAPTPTSNPLKGLIAYSQATDFPHSMEWFYLPVNAVQKGEHTYDWSALEAKLNEVAARGDQACFRFYYDYPQEPSGIPDYLLAPGPAQLQTRPYTDYGGGRCPDYNSDSPGSVKFRESMQGFIKAFGAKYDGDPRIAFITVGLLGYWGEWHTYPHEDWTPGDNVMNLVLDSYVKAFHKTRLNVRYPVANSPHLPVGFHDDAFGEDTLYEHEWNFASRLKAANISDVWKRQPIGGEVMPPIQRNLFPSGIGSTTGEHWTDCVNTVHPTWLICDAIKTYTGDARTAAITASAHMGYDFQVKTATFGDVDKGKTLKLAVDIDNNGIAPFYYHWDVLVGIKRGNAIVKTWTTNWDITTIPAGGSQKFTFTGDGLKPGAYTLAVKIVNPMPGGKPVLFANQGQHPDGWLDLGAFRAQ